MAVARGCSNPSLTRSSGSKVSSRATNAIVRLRVWPPVIIVQTTIPVDSAHREQALELFAELTECSQSEDGTIEYWAATDIAEPTVVRFFERYEDEAALTAHTETDHYRALVNALPRLADGPLRTTTFETEQSPEVARFDAEDVA